MKSLNKILIPFVFAIITVPFSANANQDNSKLNDAWLDGKLDTVILFNEHLSPFDIETDVTNRVAIISGEVDSEIAKDLTTELAKSIDGINEVDNRLQVKESDEPKEQRFSDIKDAAISTTITTKLLLNTDVESGDIDVDTSNQVVTLNGTVPSKLQRDLIEKIAENTSNVKSVKNKVSVQ